MFPLASVFLFPSFLPPSLLSLFLSSSAFLYQLSNKIENEMENGSRSRIFRGLSFPLTRARVEKEKTLVVNEYANSEEKFSLEFIGFREREREFLRSGMEN